MFNIPQFVLHLLITRWRGMIDFQFSNLLHLKEVLIFQIIIFRERSDLVSTVNILRSTVSGLQQREADALAQIQQSVEVAEQAQLERIQVQNSDI